MKRNLILTMCLLLLSASTLCAQQYWQTNPHAYQYDMTIYAQLRVDGNVVADYTDYEVAAFAEGECRGIAVPITGGKGSSYALMRVYSNEAEGETVTFKCYHMPSETEQEVANVSLEFQAGTAAGLPSAPLILAVGPFHSNLQLLGDANNDGKVNVVDITATANYILGSPSSSFVFEAADTNHDGNVNVVDIVAIANIILNGSSQQP